MIKTLISLTFLAGAGLVAQAIDGNAASSLHAWFNSVIGGATLVTMFVFAMQLGRYKERLDIMWVFHLRRGAVEGVKAGLLEVNSPVRLTEKSRYLIEHELKTDLKEFCDKYFPMAGEHDLAREIEKKFGDRLSKEVCIPNHISLSACLLVATAIAMGKDNLTEILDEAHVPRKKTELDPSGAQA